MEFPESRTGVMPVLEQWQQARKRLRWAYAGPLDNPPNHLRPFEDSGAWLVVSGEARIKIGETWVIAGAGEWLIPPPHGSTEQRFASGTNLVSIRFVFTWPDGRPVFERGLPVKLANLKFPALRTAATQLVTACGNPSPAHGPGLHQNPVDVSRFLRIERAFAEFLIEWAFALRENGVEPMPGQPIDQRVREGLRLLQEQNLSNARLARELGLSISQLDRIFMQQIGQTPRAYREQRRLERVREALRHTNETIKSIGYAAGFKRLSHFSAWFARHTGTSARRYRQRSQGAA